jgi:hypothetical protein
MTQEIPHFKQDILRWRDRVHDASGVLKHKQGVLPPVPMWIQSRAHGNVVVGWRLEVRGRIEHERKKIVEKLSTPPGEPRQVPTAFSLHDSARLVLRKSKAVLPAPCTASLTAEFCNDLRKPRCVPTAFSRHDRVRQKSDTRLRSAPELDREVEMVNGLLAYCDKK